MKIAVIHEDGEVYISIPESKVRELLTSYSQLTPTQAFDKLIEELKKEVLKR